MRLLRQKLPPFARCLHLRRVTAVVGKLFIEREQKPCRISARFGEFRGQIDEVDFPLRLADADQPVKTLVYALFAAGAAVTAIFTEGGDELFADLPFGIVLAVSREECRLDLSEERGDLVELLADGAAVAVDGDARQAALTVKKQALLRTADERFGKYGDEQRGQETGKKLQGDRQRALRVQSREPALGEVGGKQCDRGGGAPVRDEEQGNAGECGIGGNGDRAHRFGAERQRENNGERNGDGALHECDCRKQRRHGDKGERDFSECVVDPHAEQEPAQPERGKFRARKTAPENACEERAQRALRKDTRHNNRRGDDRFLRRNGHGKEGVSRMRKEKDKGELGDGCIGDALIAHAAVQACIQQEGEQHKRRLYGAYERCVRREERRRGEEICRP